MGLFEAPGQNSGNATPIRLSVDEDGDRVVVVFTTRGGSYRIPGPHASHLRQSEWLFVENSASFRCERTGDGLRYVVNLPRNAQQS
jgi:hypothetical protein